MIDTALADRIIAFLNELNALDPEGIARLVNARVQCNARLAHHPTVQVAGPEPFAVGMLGVLNGLCGVVEGGELDGYGVIAAVFNPARTAVLAFERLDRKKRPVT